MSDEANNAPSKPPLFKEAVKSLSFVSNWFDYRAFSRQRHQLLSEPNLALSESAKSDSNWKSALSFAIQGFLLTSLIIQIIVSSLGLILVRPKPYTERIMSAVQDNLKSLNDVDQTLRLNLATVEGADDRASFEWVFDIKTKPVRATFGGVPKAEYSKALRDTISEVEGAIKRAQAQSDGVAKALDLASRAEQVPSKLFRFLLPLAFVSAAYVFRFLFVRGKKTRTIENRNHSDVAYLYLTTSHLFWMNVALAVISAIVHNAFIYSGIYDREMFASLTLGQSIFLWQTQLFFMEAENAIPFVICLPLVIFSFRRASRALSSVFNLPPSTSPWVASYIRVSSFVSFLVLSVVLVFFSWGYAKFTSAWDAHKISLENPQAGR